MLLVKDDFPQAAGVALMTTTQRLKETARSSDAFDIASFFPRADDHYTGHSTEELLAWKHEWNNDLHRSLKAKLLSSSLQELGLK